jgi:hypothetical protein
MNRSLDFGMMTNHRLPESTRQSLELSESIEHSSKPIIQGLNMGEIMVLVYYANLDVGGNKMHIFTANIPTFHARYRRNVFITNEFHEFY